MTTQEVDKQLEEIRDAFYNEIFPHPLPKTFMVIFKKAVMAHSPSKIELSTTTLKAITSKKVNQLTNLDVRRMINVIVVAPIDKMYTSTEEFIENHKPVEELMMIANMELNKLDVEIGLKKKTMMELIGVGGVKPKLYQA